MIKRSLRTISAGLGLFVIMIAASSIEAQETNTVGNPQLKDFELPGTRTVPPANQQQPAPATPAPATTTPPPAATPPVLSPSVPPPQAAGPAVTAAPAPRRQRPLPPAASRQSAPPPAADVPAEVPVGVPAPGELEQALPAPPPAAPATQAPPAVLPAEPGQKVPWLYIGLGALLALLSVLALVAFKRSRASAEPRAEAEAAAEHPATVTDAPAEPDPLFARRTPAAVPAAPAAVPAPSAPAAAPADGTVSLSMRPRLELEFRADRAAATLTDTSVQYELTIRNTGNRIARDIRIQVHMMNAAADQEKAISDFYAEGVGDGEPPLFPALAPKAEVNIRSGITLPKERLREITIQGRRLFIPVVAFNVFYEWGDGRTGQTSMCYLVGREAPTPQEKLGAFRLDLGPRLYRSVGQRQGNLAKVV